MRQLVTCLSLKGSPGVTTLALAMAAAWPDGTEDVVRPVVVEADAAGGDVAARLARSHVPGLLDVAASARRPHPGSVLGAAQELPFGVRAVLAPAGAGQCREAVRLLERDGARILRGEPRDVGTVLLDVGRVRDLRQPLVALADVVVLVVRAGVDALTHVFAGRETYGGADKDRLVLAVVGECPYGRREIGQTVGIDRVVLIPWSSRSAAEFSGAAPGQLRPSGRRRSGLLAAAGELAQEVQTVLRAAPAANVGRPLVAATEKAVAG